MDEIVAKFNTELIKAKETMVTVNTSIHSQTQIWKK